MSDRSEQEGLDGEHLAGYATDVARAEAIKRPTMSDKILEVTLWVCTECAYWRASSGRASSGTHQTENPDDPSGRMVVHQLVPVRFYSEHHPDYKEATHNARP